MEILLKAYRDVNGELVWVVEGSFQDLDAIDGGLVRVVGADRRVSADELVNLDLQDLQDQITSNDTDIAQNATNIASNDVEIAELQTNQNDLISLSGVPENSTDLGTFTGNIITDNSTVKGALQEIESQVDLLNGEESSLSLDTTTNTLTHVSNQGTSTNIDLSLYLDDTNLARIVNGVLDASTGIATFTRDDNTTFTLDLSSLLDNQNANEVPVTPVGNLTSTDVQGALEELQTDIDSINGVTKEYVYANQTVAQTGIQGTATALVFDNTAVNSNTAVFVVNNTNGEIVVNKDSTFKLEYIVTADTQDGARRTSETVLEIDTGSGFAPLSAALGSATAYGYHRNNASGENSVSGQAVLTLTSGTVLRLRTRVANGTGTIRTVPSGTSISIEEK